MKDYCSWLANHTHEFDINGYCDLCGFHKDELLTISGVIYEQDKT